MRIAMTLTVRDEADIVEANLRFHAALGVDVFVIADHGSRDATRELVEPWVEAGRAQLVEVEADDILALHDRHMTALARLAAEQGANWVIHNDADEFWWPVVGDLKDALAAVPERYGTLLAPRTEFPPRPGDAPWPERLTIRETRARHRPRLAHRPHPALRLHGVHPDNLWVDIPGGQSFPGPPKLRVERSLPRPEPEVALVLAPTFPVRVLHFPIRSFEQFRRRIEIAIAKPGTFGRRAERMRALSEAGKLREAYEALLLSDAEAEAGLADASLSEDTEFRDFLRACPPLESSDPGPAGPRAYSSARRERELEELELDAMAALSVRMQRYARDADPVAGRPRRERSRRRARRRAGA